MHDTVNLVSWIIIASGVAALVVLLFVTAPYGKFSRGSFGILIDGKIAWFVFEGISFFYFGWIVSQLKISWTYEHQIAVFLWMGHYFNRSIIYTLRAPKMAPCSISVICSAMAFNIANCFVNANQIQWQTQHILFVPGCILFVIGFLVNLQSDNHLFELRRNRKSNEYFVPTKGLFQYVSCAHYFGEIIEWLGWAILTNSLPGFSFWFFTSCNLIPRALQQHKWYLEKFKDHYPRDRRAVIPFII
ncbi:3-oxo-5-alpha-steroid 4-dehydrogenase family protein [Gorgonomyces haynaldii]|nr:3-oxo-5-alpha-steroid 4-dehydrogenase family protein [Gorgonomyces haynaldii]